MPHSLHKDINFNEVLIEVIDNILVDVLGKEVAKTLYLYLKTVVFIEKRNIPKEIVAFHAGLRKLFGHGAIAIEDAIIKELFYRIGLKITVKDSFVNLIRKAKIYSELAKKRVEF